MKIVVSTLASAILVILAPFGHGNIGGSSQDALAVPSSTTFTVVNSGATAYRIDGMDNPDLLLVRGGTYVFNVTAAGHPFYIKTIASTGTGNQYTSGVTGQGVTSGSLTFVVPGDAPDELFYHCSIHSAMGGMLNITNPLDAPGSVTPARVWLGPAIPNPAKGGTHFRFGLVHEGPVQLAIFDSRGAIVRELWNGSSPSGPRSIYWDGRDRNGRTLPAGLYYCRLRYDSGSLTRGIVIRR